MIFPPYKKAPEYRFLEWVYERRVSKKEKTFLQADVDAHFNKIFLQKDIEPIFKNNSSAQWKKIENERIMIVDMPSWVCKETSTGSEVFELTAEGFFQYLRLQELTSTKRLSALSIFIAVIATLASVMAIFSDKDQSNHVSNYEMNQLNEIQKKINQVEQNQELLKKGLSSHESNESQNTSRSLENLDEHLEKHFDALDCHLDRHLGIIKSTIRNSKD